MSLNCAATDGGSGLAEGEAASFTLTTNVGAGEETDNASTDSRDVSDAVGNTVMAGPIGPNLIDRAVPVVTITAPVATDYDHSATLVLDFGATDGGSGVNAISALLDGNPVASGDVIDLTYLALGGHTLSVNATDAVGNGATAEVSFTVIATAEGTVEQVDQLVESGDVSAEIASPLQSKLEAAADTAAQGNCTAATNQLQAFIKQVEAQTGKKISEEASAILIADAQAMIASCS